MNTDWPCVVNFDLFFGAVNTGVEPDEFCFVGTPSNGQGDRCLFCDHYERCLDFAVISRWNGFNCENCTYDNRGPVVFCYREFLALLNDPWIDDLYDDEDYDFEYSEPDDMAVDQPDQW